MTTKVARMSRQTEGKILAAVEDVVDLINDGAEPNAAIIKIASAAQLPAGHVGLLVHAYNTGRTNRQREGHTGLLEKAASFPVADPAIILEALFPKEVKSAAAQERATGVHPDYEAPPHWYRHSRQAQALEKAAAQVPRLVDSKPEPYPGDPADRVKRAYNQAAWRVRQVEEARRVCAQEHDRLVACFQKLAGWLADPGNPPLEDHRENIEALWGQPGRAVLNHLGRTRPGLVKRAGERRSTLVPLDRQSAPYTLIEATIGQTQRAWDARAHLDKLAREVAQEHAETLAPFVPARPRGSLLGLPWAGSSEDKTAGAYTTALGVQLSRDLLGTIGNQLELPDKDKMTESALRSISSPQHEQQLREIHTQAMLHNMLNDPIISSYKPTEVADAFNQVSQLAPHAAQQPAIMGPLLRKWLQEGNAAGFDIDQLVGTEKKLHEMHPPPERKPAGPAGPKAPASTLGGILKKSGSAPTSILAR